MEDILTALDLGHLRENFAAEQVGAAEVLLLTDTEFASLGVSSIGNRAKLKARCRAHMEGINGDSEVRKRVEEFQAQRSQRSRAGRLRHQQQSVKTTRRIIVGWRKAAEGVFTLVNNNKGGGAHKIDVQKTCTLSELEREIQNVFFPNGVSRLQGLLLNDLDTELTTFTGEPLPDTLSNGSPFSLEGYINQIQRNPVRIYLQSSAKDIHTAPTSSSSTQETDSDELPDLRANNGADELPGAISATSAPATDLHVNVNRNRLTLNRRRRRMRGPSMSTTTTSAAVNSSLSVSSNVTDSTAGPSSVHSEQDQVSGLTSTSLAVSTPTPVNNTFEGYMEAGTPDIYFRTFEDTHDDNSTQQSETSMTAELHEAFLSLTNSLDNENNIQVCRSTILEDVLKVYENPQLPLHTVCVKFTGESGDDFGGLTKDFFTIVWKAVLQAFFQGEDALVPYLPLHKVRSEREQFIAIGRILSHMVAILNIVPPRLSRCTLLNIVYGEDSTNEKILIEDFLLYLPPEDRALISQALRNYDSLTDKALNALIDFFTINGIQEPPSCTKIRQQVLSIAQVVLIDRPSPLVSKIKQGIPSIHTDLFWSLLTIDSIDFLFQKQRPTGNKVVEIIKTTEDDLRPDEERSLYFFKQYVRQLDQEDLSDLLLFITGSTIMPDTLCVSFRNVTGEQRCPVVHTCTNHIELPASYTSLQELKREFRAVLTCSHSFEMSML